MQVAADKGYLSEFLYQNLAADPAQGLQVWSQLFDQSLVEWDIIGCRLLIREVKQGNFPADLELVAFFMTRTAQGMLEAQLGNWENAITCHQQVLHQTEQSGDTAGQAWVLSNLGNIYTMAGRLAEAEQTYRKALVVYRANRDDRGISRVQTNLGNLLRDLGELEEAKNCFFSAFEWQRNNGEMDLAALSLVGLGTILQKQGDFQQAEAAYRDTIAYFTETGDRHRQAQSLGNLGTMYLEGAQYQNALACFLEDLEILQELDDIASMTQTLNNLAITFRRLGQIDQAIECYEQCLSIKQTLEDEPGELLTLLNYAYLLSEQNSAEQLQVLLAKAQSLAGHLEDQEAIFRFERSGNKTMGQIDYELEYLDSLLDAEDASAVQRWQATFEQTLENWQADRARQLLRQVKTRSLKPQEEGLVRHLEGMFHVRMGDWKTARKTYERALEVRRELGDRYGEMVVLNSLANLLRRGDQPLPEALQLYQQAEQLAIELQEEESRYEILLGMGITYYALGAFEQAVRCLKEVLSFAQKTHSTALEASVWHNLGSIAWTQGQLEKAQEHFQKALTIERSKHDWHGEAETLNSLGLIEEAWGNWIDARFLYEQSLEIFQRAGDLYGQVQVLVNLGNLAWLSEELDISLALHLQALSIAQDLGDAKLEGQVLTGLGDTYRAQGNYPEAEQALHSAIQRKKSAGDQRSLKHTYLSLGALYQNQKRPVEAQQIYEQALRDARQQQDQRIETVTLINLSTLMLPQMRMEESFRYLDAAEKIATERDYRDCLAWIAEQRGDLELLKEEPNAEHLLQWFFEALAYAGDFNRLQFHKTLNNLLQFWQAHAEDGGISESIWFCDSIISLWEETKLSDNYPEVINAFSQLRRSVMGH